MEEVARTPDQFLAHIVFHAMCTVGDLTEKIRQFASQVGLPNLDEIDEIQVRAGVDFGELSRATQFRSLIPYVSCKDKSQYDGWFPTKGGPPQQWQHACNYEVVDDNRPELKYEDLLPPWISRDQNPKVIFENLLAVGDYHGAWLALVGTGWQIDDAIAALQKLLLRSGDSGLSAQAAGWLQLAEKYGGYY